MVGYSSVHQGKTSAKSSAKTSVKTSAQSTESNVPQTDGPPDSKKKRKSPRSVAASLSEKLTSKSPDEGHSISSGAGEKLEELGNKEAAEEAVSDRSKGGEVSGEQTLAMDIDAKTTNSDIGSEQSQTGATGPDKQTDECANKQCEVTSTSQTGNQGESASKAYFLSGKQNHRPQRRGKTAAPDTQPTG